MKNIATFLCTLSLCLMVEAGFSQQTDTIRINASNINTAWLKPAMNRYLVYFKMGKDSSRSRYQLWSRAVDYIKYQGKNAITVKQEWEDNQSVIYTVYSVCDKKTFAPLYQESWSPRGKMKADFITKQFFLRDTLLSSADTARNKKNIFDAFNTSLSQYVLNWHLDLETFPLLPYRDGVTFMINFYDPGFPEPKWAAYTVKGSAQLEGYDNQKVDCWLLVHDTPNNHQTFWISKKTQEVLKLEQEVSGRFRYKIKLGYSI